MEYLKIKCHRCGNSFVLYNKDIKSTQKVPYCPHCLAKMDEGQWERLTDAYFTFCEVNKNLRKQYEEHGEPLFQAEIHTEKKYVDPEDMLVD